MSITFELMFIKSGVYFIILLCLGLVACQKEVLESNNDYKTLGSAARDLLSNENFSSLTIEVDYMPGFAPNSQSLEELVSFLNMYLNKPGGIQVIATEVKATGKEVISLSELIQLERKHRTTFSLGKRMAVYILITDTYYNNESLLGTSYWNTSFCLFGKNINDSSGGLGQITRLKLFSILLQHEFGHLLGLVGQGSPMQENHRDADNGAHCNNPQCLMYYGIETAGNLGGISPIPKLDAQCIADLQANGGK